MGRADSTPSFGFGSATFGREVDEPGAHALLDHAYARGIRHLDTAAAYSAGRAEEIVGRWLASTGRRAEITLATKLVPPFSAAGITAGVAASLARLQVPRIDVLYLHRWDDTAESDDVLRALDAEVQAGRVGALGVSNITPATCLRMLARQRRAGLAPFRWVQNNQNYAVRDLPYADRHALQAEGVKLVTFSPLGAGFLTGKHTGGVVAGSRFAVAPAHQAIYFTPTGHARLAALTATAAHHGFETAALALAWAASRPATDFVLLGAREVGQLDLAFAARAAIPAEALRELERLHPDD
jgi:aryl-alcohol dehydrogenase-like predicted oxidoreductase